MKNNYGEEFRKQRVRMNLNQKEISSELGISVVSISCRENGDRPFKVGDLYTAYTVFGIDVGFGNVFDSIDQQGKNVERIIQNLSEIEQKRIRERDYKNMAIYTLERLKDLLWVEEDNLFDFSNIELTTKEKSRLEKVLKKYQKKDGDIERALKLLEIAVQE